MKKNVKQPTIDEGVVLTNSKKFAAYKMVRGKKYHLATFDARKDALKCLMSVEKILRELEITEK